MEIITTIHEMQKTTLSLKSQGKRIAFVPTMGYLHAGHASLLREGRQQGDILVLSIFVNPIQFGQNEDLDRYPRNLEGDCHIAGECGVDIVFTPDAAAMYGNGFQTKVQVGQLTLPLCGASRPGHFDGVATVVNKLFNIVQPDVALFGNKDYQQLAVIKRMTADLNLPVKVVGMPIIREADGLAMSSRNAYLSPAERLSGLCLSKAILKVRESYASGICDAALLKNIALNLIEAEPEVVLDYLDFRDVTTLEAVDKATANTLLAMAVKIGTTRLIDNTILGEEF